MSDLVVTTYVWGEVGFLKASTVESLAAKLYRRCPFWTQAWCAAMAEMLAGGRVVMVPDAEALFLPGQFHVTSERAEDDPAFRSRWLQVEP